MAYNVFESTLIRGKNLSFIYNDEIENGTLVGKGALIPGSRDIYAALLPTSATLATEKMYVVGNPAWDYDTSSVLNQNEERFINPANKAFRVYELTVNDKFAVADYGILPVDGSTPVAVGQFVGLVDGGTKLQASATEPAGSAFVGKVVLVRNLGAVYDVGQAVDQRLTKVTIEVVKNG